MARIKKAKDALCEQIVDIYVLRDMLADYFNAEDEDAGAPFLDKIASILSANRTAYKSLS